jgi:hypothetical protein
MDERFISVVVVEDAHYIRISGIGEFVSFLGQHLNVVP